MPLIEKATAYVLGALLQNEEFKKFPQDFISASVGWVRSWFLKDDPKTEAKLSSDKSLYYKQAVVESKLEDLLENPQFQQELESQLAEYERHAAAVQHIVQQKNVIQNSDLQAGGNIEIGDRNIQAGGNVQIIHNYAPTPGKDDDKSLTSFSVGKFTFSLPIKMKLFETIKCIVRIANKELSDEQFKIKVDGIIELIKIGKVMKVEVMEASQEKHFEIVDINDSEQFIEEDSYTEWKFNIKPIKTGKHELIVRASIIQLMEGGIERKKNINVLEKHVEVVADSKIAKLMLSAAEKEALRQLIASNETKAAIDRLNELSVGHETFRNMVLAQSGKWDDLKRAEIMGTISYSEAVTERNRIVSAVLSLIGELG